MSNVVVVHKDRTNIITVDMGMDVSGDTFSSEIRTNPDHESTLIATWVTAFATDGSDGELILTIDDTTTSQIQEDRGYMDIRRITGGEPVPVFDRPLEVEFRGTVTAN